MKKYICVVMALLMSNIPVIAAAQAAEEMIPTATVLTELSRAEAERNVQQILGRAEIRERLDKLGLTPSEVSVRLAALSDSELRQMSAQLDQASYGGDDVAGILIIVVLVLLIIYLVKKL